MSTIQIAAIALLVIITLVIGFFITEDFWNVHFLKKDWYRCVFRGRNKKMTVTWLKPDAPDGSGIVFVHFKNGSYPVVEDAQVTSGFFNVPTLYFVEGIFEAAHVKTVKDSNDKKAISAEQIEAMRKWHIFTDIMNAIDDNPLSQTMMMVILCGLIVLAAAGSYYAMGKKIDSAIAPLIPTPTATITLGVQ